MKFEDLKKFLILTGMLIVIGHGPEARSASPDKRTTGKRLEFRNVAMAEMIDEEATKAGFRSDGFAIVHLGSTKFEASDGETLITADGEFRSADEAKRYLEWKVARASKILAQGIKRDSKGKSVGYRAEVLLPPDQKQGAVMWTNGVMFFQIIAKSLADAEELERR